MSKTYRWCDVSCGWIPTVKQDGDSSVSYVVDKRRGSYVLPKSLRLFWRIRLEEMPAAPLKSLARIEAAIREG